MLVGLITRRSKVQILFPLPTKLRLSHALQSYMATTKAQKAGGRATALKLRKEALRCYYDSPNHCLACGRVIEVRSNERVSRVKRRKFCNKSCATKHHNAVSPKRAPQEVVYTKSTTTVNNIRRRARKAYAESGKSRRCSICSYDKHVEIAHIKSIASFAKDALVSKINNISNLTAFCPNHHWEHDHCRNGRAD